MLRPVFHALLCSILAAQTALAFPWMAQDPAYQARSAHARDASFVKARAEVVHSPQPQERQLLGVLSPFSGILAGVDVPTVQTPGLKLIPGNDPTHEFQKPGPTDVRGLCPTLNTLANHGYISRTGITNFAEVANAQQIAYGMGYDMASVLSLLGLFAGGDLLSGMFSIGGPDPRVPSTLGTANGINAHGRFEADASPTRSDFYFGDDHSLNRTRFNSIVTLANEYEGLFDQEPLYQDRVDRYQESRAINPTAYFGPGYLAVSAATRFFWYRILSNGTTPDTANYANVAPFYLNETFPPAWFRRGTPYNLEDFAEDVADYALNSPVELGQNQGYDNFVPLSANVPSDPIELLCFTFTALLSVTPQQGASNVLAEVVSAVNGYNTQVIQPLFGPVLGGKCNVTAEVVSPGDGGSVYGSR